MQLQQLTDQLVEDDQWIAEEMVKAEGANADEIPDLPPGTGDEPLPRSTRRHF